MLEFPQGRGILMERCLLYLITLPFHLIRVSQYFIPWAREGKMRPEARDPTEGERLWQWLESETKE